MPGARCFVHSCYVAVLLFAWGMPAWADEAASVSESAVVDFTAEIQPLLIRRCSKCHGGIKRESGLSLIDRRSAFGEALSGERAIVPGQPQRSELITRIAAKESGFRMPPVGKPLTEQQIQLVRRWVEQGAHWPTHWAVQRIRRPSPPKVNEEIWPRNPIDRFILARLEHEHLQPSPPADRHALIRRLFLDLTGLLPSPEEVHRFITDQAPDSYERLVDRLLASPHFGERWGRHWLDLARYADTDGYEVDGVRPNAWHWRDWVIDAVNQDMPFDQFTVEQLAGDLLPEAERSQKLATAFHRQTLTNKEGGVDQEEYRVYAVMDRVSTTAIVWLGLTMNCSQCHDHPYDPISQREYYQLFAFFDNAEESNLELPRSPEALVRYRQKQVIYEQKLNDLQAQLAPTTGDQREEIQKQIEQLRKKAPRKPVLKLRVMSQRPMPRQTFVLRRGEFLHPLQDEEVQPHVPSVLHAFHARDSSGMADRLDLARWLVDPNNPLTARVAVNRIWQHLFGQGLVRTPGDFGAQGEPPTHPQLLDWLASEYQRRGWSRKAMIRLIVNSATYRQSSRHRPLPAQRDPDNRLLYRQNSFRLEAEAVRDVHLVASGLLARKVGGPSVFPPFPPDLIKIDFRSDLKWETSKGTDRYRRGLYTFFKRTLPHPNLVIFNCPDASATAVHRVRSNTPLQALARLNNEVFVDAARALGRRILQSQHADDAQRLDYAWRLCLIRPPTEFERQRLLKLLNDHRTWYRAHEADAIEMVGPYQVDGISPTETAAWIATANILMNLDEFITRE